MNRPKIRKAHGPEYGIQKEICCFLRERGWHVERIVGIGWQFGLPDLYITHPKWGQRWLEVKNPGEYTFTKAQRIKFPILDKYGTGIWLLTAATEDEYEKLFKGPNWKDYWKKTWGPIDIDALLAELENEDASSSND
jgi:hypothetical protein